MRNRLWAILLPVVVVNLVAGCGADGSPSGTTQRVRATSASTKRNANGITRVEVRRSTDGRASLLEVRGLDEDDRPLAYLTVVAGTVEFSYDEGDATTSTSGRQVSLGLLTGDTVRAVMPGSTTQTLLVPGSLASFASLPEVQREAALAGIAFEIDGDVGLASGISRRPPYRGHDCNDYPGVWNKTAAGAMPDGSTCSLDVLDGDTFPYRSFQCVKDSGGKLVSSRFSATPCSMDREGTDHACGIGPGSPGQCVYGPCQKAGVALIAIHDAGAGNPNCSAGYNAQVGADWEYFVGGVRYCSGADGDRCSHGNGTNPAQGCFLTSCCYDPYTGKGCAYAGACPVEPSCL